MKPGDPASISPQFIRYFTNRPGLSVVHSHDHPLPCRKITNRPLQPISGPRPTTRGHSAHQCTRLPRRSIEREHFPGRPRGRRLTGGQCTTSSPGPERGHALTLSPPPGAVEHCTPGSGPCECSRKSVPCGVMTSSRLKITNHPKRYAIIEGDLTSQSSSQATSDPRHKLKCLFFVFPSFRFCILPHGSTSCPTGKQGTGQLRPGETSPTDRVLEDALAENASGASNPHLKAKTRPQNTPLRGSLPFMTGESPLG